MNKQQEQLHEEKWTSAFTYRSISDRRFRPEHWPVPHEDTSRKGQRRIIRRSAVSTVAPPLGYTAPAPFVCY